MATRLGGGLSVERSLAARIAELAARIAEHRGRYYAGSPSVSDAAFDALEDELRQLDPANPVLAQVGADVAAAWEKARHEIPMGSLNKVTTPDELREWATRCDELLAKQGEPPMSDDLFVAEKLDGLSLELVYEDGRFVDGITRGDGEIGERISSNVRRMRGVPLRIAERRHLSVRGEIILRLSDRQEHFPDYGSPRNAAAGTARRLDGSGNEHLTVVSYDLAEEIALASEVDKIALLRQLGFATPQCYRGSVDEVIALYEDYGEKVRGGLDYEIDGLVVSANRLAAQAHLGDVNRRPRGAVAFKFASPVKLSKVVAIRWDTGPSGRVTPVAEVEPVELVGAMVRRASLHNAANVRRLGIGVGDEVMVSRRNDVIPYVEEVVEHVGAAAEPPASCSVCQSPLVSEGEYLLCRNDGCVARLMGRIKNWIDAVGVLEWGDKLVATLVDKGLVKEPRDLYALTVDQIAALERHGQKSAQNALDALHSRLPLQLPVFLAALGIEGFGLQTARLLQGAGYDSIEKLLGASEEELAAIMGLGELKARNIVAGVAARRAEIGRLIEAGLGPVSHAVAGPLAGKTFCVTGSHARSRKELTQLIEDAGGRVLNGVSKDLHYLLIADPESTSSKAVKARRYGTELIDEAGLDALIAKGSE